MLHRVSVWIAGLGTDKTMGASVYPFRNPAIAYPLPFGCSQSPAIYFSGHPVVVKYCDSFILELWRFFADSTQVFVCHYLQKLAIHSPFCLLRRKMGRRWSRIYNRGWVHSIVAITGQSFKLVTQFDPTKVLRKKVYDMYFLSYLSYHIA